MQWRLILLCVASGALAVAAFGDWPLWPLPILSLALLFWACSHAPSPWSAFTLGFAWGSGFFLAGVSWVYVSLHNFGMMPMPLAALATLLFCLFLALFPAIATYLQARLASSPALGLLCMAPAAWCLTEWTRGWLFTGFPWLAIGYSQVGGPLAGYAPVLGVYGVSLLVAVVAAAIVMIARRIAIKGSIALLCFISLLGFLGREIHWTEPKTTPLSVGLLQGNIPQSVKFRPERYDNTLSTYAALAEKAEAKLIVLPEVAIPRLLSDVDPAYIAKLRAYALANEGDLLLPVPVRDEAGIPYNAVISLGAAPSQSYAKRHLVPFGEFVPPGFGWIVNILHIPLSDFGRGSLDQRPLAVAGEKVALNICYEDAFGEEIIRQLPEATVLVNVSNVAWFGDSLAPAQHLRIARMRALETGRYMLRATNTGVTAIIDERGEVQGRLPNFEEGALRGEALGHTGATPYVRVGNWAAVCIACALLFMALWRPRAFRRISK
ncbi:MAG TPA: apolipoprotein N-acyltransferase [Burkholderiales bacterium]|nr:apolipoprotein N-acyltransferase [Burkholderiales bacterium]